MKKELYASLLLLLVFISCSAMYRGTDFAGANALQAGNSKCISAFAQQPDFCCTASHVTR